MRSLLDHLLILRIQIQQNRDQFTELYDTYVDAIYRFIFMRVGDRETAQDLTSDVFLKAWRALTQGEQERIINLRAFLYAIARNRVIDHYRTRKAQTVPLYPDMPVSDHGIDIHQDVADKLDGQHVYPIIKRLKNSYQEVLLLSHVDSLSIKEISFILEKKTGATRILLHRANKALKREYEKTFIQHSTESPK